MLYNASSDHCELHDSTFHCALFYYNSRSVYLGRVAERDGHSVCPCVIAVPLTWLFVLVFIIKYCNWTVLNM